MKNVGSLAMGVLLYAVGNTMIALGAAKLYDACMETWGVTAENVYLGPWWIRGIVYGYGTLLALIQLLWVLAVCTGMERLGKRSAGNRKGVGKAGVGLALGAALALTCAAGLLLTDSIRWGWPPEMPRLQAGTVWLLPALLASSFGREYFFRRFLYGGIAGKRLAVVVTAGLCGVLHGISRPFSGLHLLNVCLMSAALCMIYVRTGSLWAGIGFRVGFEGLSQAVLGFESSGYGLYELYFVSKPWLSGGTQGPMAGLWMTLLLCGWIAWMQRAWLGERFQSLLRRR